MQISWEGVLAGITIIGFFSGVIALYVRLQFRGFAEEIVKQLDDRYVLRSECEIKHLKMRFGGESEA